MVESSLRNLQDRPASLFSQQMFSLTRRERALVAFVLLAFCIGVGVKHWRDGRALASLQAGIPSPR
jgi:hypothetical protein